MWCCYGVRAACLSASPGASLALALRRGRDLASQVVELHLMSPQAVCVFVQPRRSEWRLMVAVDCVSHLREAASAGDAGRMAAAAAALNTALQAHVFAAFVV
jgi:hypothetical protein